ncbi:hypothetical protein [Mucilaginibacter sp.]|uniref:hypothetical protein n=1 Tax=Mucilaginibacter sp. TaxID=1882438 RepID=UPI003D0F3725
MRKIFIYVFVAFLALIMIGVSIIGFDPAVEKWTSLIAGAAIGFLIVKLPTIIAYVKSKRQKSAK